MSDPIVAIMLYMGLLNRVAYISKYKMKQLSERLIFGKSIQSTSCVYIPTPLMST